jgi:hypothetical protein
MSASFLRESLANYFKLRRLKEGIRKRSESKLNKIMWKSIQKENESKLKGGLFLNVDSP